MELPCCRLDMSTVGHTDNKAELRPTLELVSLHGL